MLTPIIAKSCSYYFPKWRKTVTITIFRLFQHPIRKIAKLHLFDYLIMNTANEALKSNVRMNKVKTLWHENEIVLSCFDTIAITVLCINMLTPTTASGNHECEQIMYWSGNRWLSMIYITWFNRSRSILQFVSIHFETKTYQLSFSVRLLSVLRGHSVLSSPPQRPMTSDFEGFSIPDVIHYI